VSEGARCERERMKDIVQSTGGETEGKREREREREREKERKRERDECGLGVRV
jgi:hypothetical protein